jgi:hypothetical protein
MTLSRRTSFAVALATTFIVATVPVGVAHAQRAQLPRTRADVLLESGLWPQAEEAYYAQSSTRTRDPVARAALGRYLAMKGAVLPGTVLIEEAMQFGLDSALGKRLLRPWRSVLAYRSISTLQADSVIRARAPEDSLSLFRISFPGNVMNPLRRDDTDSRPLWVDVVPRQIGVDSVASDSPRIGIEGLEAFVPSYDTVTKRVTLHADPRSALRAEGERYRVLRDSREVRVLMTSGRTLSLTHALAELAPRWWQLDLLHGWLVVRR